MTLLIFVLNVLFGPETPPYPGTVPPAAAPAVHSVEHTNR